MKNKLNKEEFERAVIQIVQLIPKGRVTSYGAIAKATGYPTLSRMVGKILSSSSTQGIPAHRVVNSAGLLSGKLAFPTPSTMEKLLISEGVQVENNRVKDWKNIFWNPLTEISTDE